MRTRRSLEWGLYTLSQPGAGLRALKRTQSGGTNTAGALACPSITLCVARDSAGNVSVGAPRLVGARVPTIRVTRGRLASFSAAARRVGRLLSVDPGLAVACPAGGPACTVTAKVTAPDTDPLAPKLIGRLAISVRAGRRRELTFRLNPAGAKLLVQNHFLVLVALKAIARDGHGAAVAEERDLDITAPKR